MKHAGACHSRRAFLKAGVLGAGLSLGQYLRAKESADAASAILVFLKGGPSHQDSFDLKPNAPAEYRGEFKPIATSVPGIQICEHLPRLARRADRYALIRGVTHNLADHGLGTRYLLTGNRPTPVLNYPTFGSVVSRESKARPDVPPFVAIDEDPQGPGHLGARYGPLNTGDRPRPNQPFRVRGITLDDGLTVERFERRRKLADDVDAAFRAYEALDETTRSLGRLSQQAHEIISSPRTREAFDLERESQTTRQQFGNNESGMSLLLASRLIEAGVRFVTVIVENWDTHSSNFTTLKNDLLPRLDQSLSALFDRLQDRGLLSTTTVLTTGEFGRTPKVNGGAGRDHWARAMFSLLAGGRVRGGQVIGATDDRATEPKGEAVTPDDVAASFYRSIGIDPQTEFEANTGRPITLVRDGRVIPDLLK